MALNFSVVPSTVVPILAKASIVASTFSFGIPKREDRNSSSEDNSLKLTAVNPASLGSPIESDTTSLEDSGLNAHLSRSLATLNESTIPSKFCSSSIFFLAIPSLSYPP